MSGAVVSGDRSMPQASLEKRAVRAAHGFRALGLVADDTVAILMRNDFPLFETSWGAGLIGAFNVPINWHFGTNEIAHILRDSRAKVLVVHADLVTRIIDAVPSGVPVLVAPTPPEVGDAYRIAAEDRLVPDGMVEWDCWLDDQEAETLKSSVPASSIIYTSGTTGLPKGVRRVVTSPNLAVRPANSVADLFAIGSDARTVITGPMYHSALNSYGLGMAAAGASVWLQPRFDAEELLRMIQDHRLTHLHLVPIMFVRLLKLPESVRQRFDVSSLRHVVHAGAPCPPDVKRQMIEWWGPIIGEYYGSTELRAVVSCTAREWLEHPGTVGRTLSDTDVAILDEAGRRLPAGAIGEIYARNHAAEDFTYTGDPEMRARVERDGLITSGDMGYLDADGFLYLCDRRSDMVNSGGVNIYPAEIEACLLAMPGVQDCAVFGVPDKEYGEALAAVVQPRPGMTLDAAAVQSYVRARMAGYKTPKLVTFADTLPREDTGKIFKRKLREPYWLASGRRI